VEAGLVEFIDSQKEVAECLSVESLPGHTPGHLSFCLRSRGEEGIFAGDVMHHPIQIAKPEWNSGFCLLPDLARRSRFEFLERAADAGALMMPCHFGPPLCGYIRKESDGYRFESVTW
jgi:glyoxylase-like metal-dependent hydrolase (beta-lactamase superfamily II)